MSTPALSLDGATKTYGRLCALNAATLSLPCGVTAGLVGPNGAGKTTLYSLAAGFIRPTSGTVRIFGQDPRRLRGQQRLLGILPQDARFQRHVPLRLQMRWYGQLMGLDMAEASREVERVLELVDLRQAAERTGDVLSHGMHKRMALAQAFIGSPRLVLLDEPTAGLDPANAHRIRELIRELSGTDTTVVVSSHNLAEIGDYCDHITVLKKGTVVRSEPLGEFRQEQALCSFVLEAPASTDLLGALEAHEEVSAVKAQGDGSRLECQTTEVMAADPARIAELMQILAAHGARVRGFSRGANVEQRFLEVTGS